MWSGIGDGEQDAGALNAAEDSKPSATAAAPRRSRRRSSREDDNADAKRPAAPPAAPRRSSRRGGRSGNGVEGDAAARSKSTRENANQPAATSAPRRSIRRGGRSGSGVEGQDDAADDHRSGWDDARDTIVSRLPPRIAISRAVSEKKAQDDLQKKNTEEDANYLRRHQTEVEAAWSAKGASFGKWIPFSEDILRAQSFWGIYFIMLKSGLILFGKASGDEGEYSKKSPLYRRIRTHIQLLTKDERDEMLLLVLPTFTNEGRLRLRILEEIIHMSILAHVGPKNMGVIATEEANISPNIIENEVAKVALSCLTKREIFLH